MSGVWKNVWVGLLLLGAILVAMDLATFEEDSKAAIRAECDQVNTMGAGYIC